MTAGQIKKVVSATLSRFDDSDLTIHHGIDAVDEITKILNKQINQSVRKQKIQSKIKKFFNI